MEKKRCEIADAFKWNLKDMIKDSEEYERLCTEINMLADKIVAMKGNIVKNSDNLLKYLETSSRLDELLEKVYVYSYLFHYEDMSNEIGINYKERAERLVESVNTKTYFTSSELLSIPYGEVLGFIKENKELKKYSFLLEKIFRYQKYTLSEKEEKIITLATNSFGTPHDAFSCLDNVDIDLGYIKDEYNKRVKLTNSNYIKFMSSSNRNVRKQAFKNMYAFFARFINTISELYKGKIKENYFLSNAKGFNSPLEKSLYSDNIEVNVYNNFINEIHDYLPLMYRYMKVRNKALGIKSHMYDIYVDLGKSNNNEIKYDDGIKIVKEALKPLGDKYIEDLNHAFTDGWIDVYPNKYKRSGAYQWGCYGVHPYVSLNYENNNDSVSTLAHELGHAMHTFYSNESQSYNDANYPIFLAEIASTVNEVLVDDYFYKNAKNDNEKILYLSSFLNKVRTTIFRQTMFAEFEKIIHEKYQKNVPITVNLLCDTYYDLNKLYFGKNIVIDDAIKYEWARIPHFYTSFYVYKYATGLIAALSIASDIINNENDMQTKYMEFLKSGASDYPLNILKKTSVDITDKMTIKKAFAMFEEKLQMLEELIDKKV